MKKLTTIFFALLTLVVTNAIADTLELANGTWLDAPLTLPR